MDIREGSRVSAEKKGKENHRTANLKYMHSDKGTVTRGREHSVRRDITLHNYLTREFVSWDGEGINEPDGSHTYCLLASSDGAKMLARNGLATKDVFETWLSARKGVTNIMFVSNYDINMILKDLPREALDTLYHSGKVRWEGYWMEWRAGKCFDLRKGERSFFLYDIGPFFQTSFVKACDEYLGTEWPYRSEIIREKDRRGRFAWDDIESVGDYNRAELENTISLADELRERLYKVDLRVSRWDGPGAIATALYRKHSTKQAISTPPKEVILAGRHAYAGGRFEIIRKGHSLEGAYQYDIRSAYPSAIRYLPCCHEGHGEWRHRSHPPDIRPFGVYRIQILKPYYDSETRPHPLWMRNTNGTVFFDNHSAGWYWSPEAQLAKELPLNIIHEGYEWESFCECNPFGFVEGLYNKRAALKRAGDGAHVALKLALNSMYGKMAQQIGWDAGPPLRLPPYHSLEWAGFITSHCRAQMYRAAMQSIDDIIAFETDAIFSRVPLNLPIGERLGEFDVTNYSSLTYLKSGFYFGTKEDGKEVVKSRGFKVGSVTRAQVVKALASNSMKPLKAEQTRFIGIGVALQQGMDKWLRWETKPRDIKIALEWNGKRIDLYDNRDSVKEIGDGWTETMLGMPDTEFSCKYPIAWAEKDDTVAEYYDEELEIMSEGITDNRIEGFRAKQAHEIGLNYG